MEQNQHSSDVVKIGPKIHKIANLHTIQTKWR